jgi:hypothetical protein
MVCLCSDDASYEPVGCIPVTQRTAAVHALFSPRDDDVSFVARYLNELGNTVSYPSSPPGTSIFVAAGCGGISPCPSDQQCILRVVVPDLIPGRTYTISPFCVQFAGPDCPLKPSLIVTTFPEQTCTTSPATGISDTQVVVSGVVTVGAVEGTGNYTKFTRPDANRVRYKFQWGLTTAYGNETALQGPVQATGNSPDVTVFATIGNLTPNTTYHYRIVAVTDEVTAVGQDRSLITATVPTAIGVL